MEFPNEEKEKEKNNYEEKQNKLKEEKIIMKN